MNKTAIKKFAVWAREKLLAEITFKAGLLGITEAGIKPALSQSGNGIEYYDIGTNKPYAIYGAEIKQRKDLVSAIKVRQTDMDYKSAYEQIIDEVAYTWFNRLIAIRFMEINDYLPSRIRILSSLSGKNEPDIVTTPFEAQMVYSDSEKAQLIKWKNDEKLDEMFRYLFLKQCNELNKVLPVLFEKTEDYTELLLTLSFTDSNGIIYRLVHDIDEDDFNVKKEGQVEIIGWMYQYYISKKHEQVVDPLHGKTIKKDDIPAATQLFTTDWVVRYMVDNSLGRYWIERNSESDLVNKLEFFVRPKDGHINYITEKIEPPELTFLDPCMGSGHILVYAFDVLMEIYRECGYTDRDAVQSIVENNLYGLDIDKRAYQLAYFAVMMKARSYNKRFFSCVIKSNLTYIEESNGINQFTCGSLTNDKIQNEIGEYLINVYKHAQEYGSLQSVAVKDYVSFRKYLDNLENSDEIDIFASTWLNTVRPQMYQFVKQAEIMSKRYTVVCTNPPYMNKFEEHLKAFIQDNFEKYKGDLFCAFIYRNFNYCKKNGYSAFMTPNVWMFIKTYESLRKLIISQKNIVTLIQMAKGAFFKEATVDICSFVLRNIQSNEKGLFFRLEDFKGGMDIQKEKVLEGIANPECGYFYEANQSNFSKIPGSPIAYWVSNNLIKVFECGYSLKNYGDTRQGMATSNNNRFLRLWHEIDYDKLGLGYKNSKIANESGRKWFPYNKGGEFRKWYGNIDFVINYEHDGIEVKSFAESLYKSATRTIKSISEYFKPCLSWSKISSGSVAFRFYPQGFIFDVAGCCIFYNDSSKMVYDFSFLNSKISKTILLAISPTLNYETGHIASLPIIYDPQYQSHIKNYVTENIQLSKSDWDSFETSWDFKRNPLVNDKRLTAAYIAWKLECEDRFQQLKKNEEELNRIFIDIYGLQDELTPDVADRDVTVHRVFDSKDDVPESMKGSNYVRTMRDEIVSLISYAVGCMFGRYSLDKPGLVFAGYSKVEQTTRTLAGDDPELEKFARQNEDGSVSYGSYYHEVNQDNYKSFPIDTDNIIPICDDDYFDDDITERFVKWVETVYGSGTLEDNLRDIADALGGMGTPREVIRSYFLNDFYADHLKIYQKRPIYWLFDSGKQNGFKALVYLHRYDADTTGRIRVNYLHRMDRIYESEIERMTETIEHSSNNREIASALKRREKLQKQLRECRDYDEKIAHLALGRIEIDLDDGVKVNYRKVQTDKSGRFYEILADSKNIMSKINNDSLN